MRGCAFPGKDDEMTEAVRMVVPIGENGEIVLPEEIRQRANLRHGDSVAVTATDAGLSIVPTDVELAEALDSMGAAIRAAGLTLEELIESEREVRGELLREEYERHVRR